MKKKSLFSLLGVLVLSLSLGACNEEIADDSGEINTDIEEETDEDTIVDSSGVAPTPETNPLTDEEIIDLILEEINILKTSGLTWTSFYKDSLNKGDNSGQSTYLTIKNNYTYGLTNKSINGDVTSISYYYQGEELIVKDDEYKTGSNTINYADSLKEISDSIFEGLDTSVNSPILTTEDNIYTLTLDGGYDVLCTRNNDTFTIFALKLENETTKLYVEDISLDDVEQAMADFHLFNWRDPSNPGELIDKANVTNYTATLIYTKYVGTNTMTYAEYTADPDAGDALLTSEVELSSYTIYRVYYMEDCILAEYYVANEEEEFELASQTICVDSEEDGVVWEYVSYDNYNWYYDYNAGYGYTWDGYYFSLRDAYNYDMGSHFVLDYTTDGVDYYSLDDEDADGNWFSYIGADWIFSGSGASLFGFTRYSLEEATFNTEEQTLKSTYKYDNIGTVDYWVKDDSVMTYSSETFSCEVSSVGETDYRDQCFYIHEAIQELIPDYWY